MKFDDIIAEIGEFGPYQRRVYFLVCLVGVPAALQTMVGVFVLAIPDHRCALLGLDNDTYKSQGQWHDDLVNMSIPWSTDDDAYEQCKLFEGAGSSNLDRNKTLSCNRWVYDKDPFENTFITETDLVCDDISLRTYANMILMGGLLGGSLIMGSLSDIIGRKKVLLIAMFSQFVFALATAFVTSYIPFVILRFFTTFFGIGGFLSAFVIGMELVGSRYRKFAGIVIEFFWVIGLFIETGLAYGLREWKYLQIAVSAPIILLVPIFYFFLPDSPRWLINKDKLEEASKVLQKAAKSNGVTLSNKMLKLEDLDIEGKGEKIWHMFTTPRLLIRSLIIFFNWLDAVFVDIDVAVVSQTLFVSLLLGDAATFVCSSFLLFNHILFIFCVLWLMDWIYYIVKQTISI